MKLNSHNVSTVNQKRIHFILRLAMIICLVVYCKVFQVQILQGDAYAEQAQNQWTQSTQISAARGGIYDRNGNTLAINGSAETVVARPKQIEDKEEAARLLAPLLEMDEADVLETISKDKSEIYVKRRIDGDTADSIRALEIEGIVFTEETKRFYPLNHLASQTIGFMGIDEGLSGIEYMYDQYLSGYAGKIIAEMSRDGTKTLPLGTETYYEAQNGLDITLTLDIMIQSILENGLKRAMEEHESMSATAIAMNPQTGEVLAMASLPDYDPNNYQDFDQSTWKNQVISSIYEPGSTFKTFTMAAAIEENLLTDEDTFYCDGHITVSGLEIGCWQEKGHGTQNYFEIFDNSCNPGHVTVGNELGKFTLTEYIDAFGFGSRTNVGWAGEEPGIVTNVSRIGPVELATMSFGQGISVTPLQLITGFSAVINGGYLLEPYIVDTMTTKDGTILEDNEPEVVRQVISEETSQIMRDMLYSVVENGTGTPAQVEGYKVGGKTGTSQKYIDGKYVASFIGAAPMDNPQIALLITVDEPSAYSYTGGGVTAPMFGSMMAEILNYMNMEIDHTIGTVVPTKTETVPEVRHMEKTEAINVLQNKGFEPVIEGEGEIVVSQNPSSTSELPIGSSVTLFMGSREEEGVIMPDLTGKTIKEVSEWLTALGLKVVVNGSGFATAQSQLQGTEVAAGTVIEVTFSN